MMIAPKECAGLRLKLLSVRANKDRIVVEPPLWSTGSPTASDDFQQLRCDPIERVGLNGSACNVTAPGQ